MPLASAAAWLAGTRLRLSTSEAGRPEFGRASDTIATSGSSLSRRRFSSASSSTAALPLDKPSVAALAGWIGHPVPCSTTERFAAVTTPCTSPNARAISPDGLPRSSFVAQANGAAFLRPVSGRAPGPLTIKLKWCR